MRTSEVRDRYLKFMENKGHTIVPSSLLVPENDPTTLFTGSGMQAMIQYLLGAKSPNGDRVSDSQKCFRADDIEEIGDNRHTTFFEMLGNWSFGDYFKKEQIDWMWEFLTDKNIGLGLDPNRLYITAFGGDKNANIGEDIEAPKYWKEKFASVGIEAKTAKIGSEEDGAKRGMKDGERIFYYESKKNWWSRAGVPENMPAGEPGGPDSEMFYEFTEIEHDKSFGEYCHPNCDCGRFVEIGNNVFMQYKKQDDGTFVELENKNIDFGGGLERLTAATNNNPDVFTIDTMYEIINFLERVGDKRYSDNAYRSAFRIVADHMRAAVFLIGDGVYPSNMDSGYFVRRLLRRSIRFSDVLGIGDGHLYNITDIIVDLYGNHYKNLVDKRDDIKNAIDKEEVKFRKTLENGIKEFNKIKRVSKGKISGTDAFILFTTYGFPVELTQELAEENGMTVDIDGFTILMKEHQEKSRVGSGQKFKGGLADHSEVTTAYHTATHLLLAGLRKYVGEDVSQKGSNITAERVRFDFNNDSKVEKVVLDKIEDFVNKVIDINADVIIEEMSKQEAKDSGATGAFWEKYPDIVTIYKIQSKDGVVYSRELCGGPHVEKTGEIAKFGRFRIVKESSSSAGVRRIKAVFEK